METNLTALIEEQKKELEREWKQLEYYLPELNPDEHAVYQVIQRHIDQIVTTAITKGYEIALEEVEKRVLDEREDMRNDGYIQYLPTYDSILTHIAHLKENVVE